jgi:hypothetical protein
MRTLCPHCRHNTNYFIVEKQRGKKLTLTLTHERTGKINNFTEVLSPGGPFNASANFPYDESFETNGMGQTDWRLYIHCHDLDASL